MQNPLLFILAIVAAASMSAPVAVADPKATVTPNKTRNTGGVNPIVISRDRALTRETSPTPTPPVSESYRRKPSGAETKATESTRSPAPNRDEQDRAGSNSFQSRIPQRPLNTHSVNPAVISRDRALNARETSPRPAPPVSGSDRKAARRKVKQESATPRKLSDGEKP